MSLAATPRLGLGSQTSDIRWARSALPRGTELERNPNRARAESSPRPGRSESEPSPNPSPNRSSSPSSSRARAESSPRPGRARARAEPEPSPRPIRVRAESGPSPSRSEPVPEPERADSVPGSGPAGCAAPGGAMGALNQPDAAPRRHANRAQQRGPAGPQPGAADPSHATDRAMTTLPDWDST